MSRYPALLLEKNTVSRNFFDNFMHQQNVIITPEIELGSIDLLIDLVKIGLGFSFVSQEYEEKELAAKELFTLDVRTDIPPRYLGILTHNDLPVPIAVQKFIALLQITAAP